MRYLTFLLLALASFVASAADPDERVFTAPTMGQTLPIAGAWINPAAGGTGYTLDVGPTGFIYVVMFMYQPTGAAYWYTMQAQFEPATDQERLSQGIIGRARSPLYEFQGGQCLACPFTQNRLLRENAGGEIVFFSSTEGELRFGTFRQPIRGYQLAFTPDRVIERVVEGRWMIAYRGGFAETVVIADVRAQLTPSIYGRGNSVDPRAQLAPFNRQFLLECTSLCRGMLNANGRPPLNESEFNQLKALAFSLVFSYDDVSRRLVAHRYGRTSQGVLQYQGYFDVVLGDRGNTMFLRAAHYQSPTTNTTTSGIEYVFARLPNDFVPRSALDGV